MSNEGNMVIAVMDRDRPGIVAEVTEGISVLGGNLADLSQTVLCGYFTMILVADFPATLTEKQIQQRLSEGSASHVLVVKADSMAAQTDRSEHIYVLSAVGRDRVGLVAQVSRFCCDHGVNILDLTSHAEADRYTMMLQIDLSSVGNVVRFERELLDFGERSGLSLVLQHNDIFKVTNEIAL